MSTPNCWCERCDIQANAIRTRMWICPECGDKRCEKARFHGNRCSTKMNLAQTLAETAEKPPIGVMPESVWNWHQRRNRMIELMQAMLRYSEAGKPVPVAWCEELMRRIEEHIPAGGKP